MRTSVRAAILEHEPPPVSSLQPLVPPALDDIVRRCLAKHPDRAMAVSERRHSRAETGTRIDRAGPYPGAAAGRGSKGGPSVEMGCRHPARGAHGICRVGHGRRVSALVDEASSRPDSIRRRPAARRSVRRPGTGILRRRDDGATHCRPGDDRRTTRHLEHVGHALQKGPEASADHCARIAGRRDRRRFGRPGGRSGSNHRQTDQGSHRRNHLGAEFRA